ncbi:regulator of G protein signaling superfamily [Rhodotorula sp. JG-1b]|nr:regulator of G protein signaling superfamily [Rhodotorula sp. JG-1b]
MSATSQPTQERRVDAAAASQPGRNQPIVRNRLPSLAEVLRRNTRPPVDLYCYYLFLQREGSEDTLDFWLDVQQHENLCRAYFKDLQKSGIAVRDDWPQYARYARTRGSIYGNVTGIRRSERDATAALSHAGEKGPAAARTDGGGLLSPTASESGGFAREQLRTPSPHPGQHVPQYPLSPTLRAMYPHDDEFGAGGAGSTAEAQLPGSGNTTTGGGNAQPFIMRSSAISRTDLIASAERIFTRYLMPGADKEIYLPPSLRITSFPLSSSTLPAVTHPDYDREAAAQAAIPDLFHRQKEFVYRAMESDSFPRFLRTKAFGNLTPLSALTRLAIGLLALWAGLATGFAFIFLDAKPKVRRLWVILPFTVSIMYLVAWSYDLDPLLVFMGLSETTPFRTIGIREPYVRKLLFGRALWVTFLTAVIVAVLTVIFWAVPGHRL